MAILESVLTLLLLAVVSFVQNMAFTFTSRSRNSGDPSYHRYAAYGSNGIWYACQFVLMGVAWTQFMKGEWLMAVIAGLVYTIATAEGSVLMMKIMLPKTNPQSMQYTWCGIKFSLIERLFNRWFVEKDSRKVGA